MIENTTQPQKLAKLRVYPGADADFTLYQDDGNTYSYEQGNSSITQLHCNNASHKLSHTGAAAWSGSDANLVEIIHAK